MDDLRRELHAAADLIAEYREGLPDAQVTPRAGRADIRDALGGPVPPDPTPLHEVIEELVRAVGPGLMASAGPRYFRFVTGGSIDAALIADVLTVGWDQAPYNRRRRRVLPSKTSPAGG